MDPIEGMSLTGGRVPAGLKAEDTSNMVEIEQQFSVKATRQIEVYWNLLKVGPASDRGLTKLDKEIYEHFRRDFPDINVEKINEDELKSKAAKERWRTFLMSYEKKIQDFNFGTILRLDPYEEYDNEGTILVPRMQFYAIEIARNREFCNDWVYLEAQGLIPVGTLRRKAAREKAADKTADGEKADGK